MITDFYHINLNSNKLILSCLIEIIQPMRNLKNLSFAVFFIMASTTILAQEKWAVELRPNLNFPTEKIGETHLKTGFGVEFAINYKFMEHLGAYAGWGWNQFKSDTSGNESDTDFEETGYTFGLQFIHPLGTSEKLSYLARVGGIYNHVEIENTEGNISEDSGHGLGWELGIGVQYDFGNAWLLRPQIGYRSLTGDFDIIGAKVDFDLNYVAFGVGLAKGF